MDAYEEAIEQVRAPRPRVKRLARGRSAPRTTLPPRDAHRPLISPRRSPSCPSSA